MLRKPTFWISALVGFVGVRLLAGCGSPSLLQCRVDAVSALPLDPDTITVGDAREVARRVKACQQRGDAGP